MFAIQTISLLPSLLATGSHTPFSSGINQTEDHWHSRSREIWGCSTCCIGFIICAQCKEMFQFGRISKALSAVILEYWRLVRNVLEGFESTWRSGNHKYKVLNHHLKKPNWVIFVFRVTFEGKFARRPIILLDLYWCLLSSFSIAMKMQLYCFSELAFWV